MREINVSRAGDPIHAGDKALTLETPVQRGRVNRYGGGYIYKKKQVCKTPIVKIDRNKYLTLNRCPLGNYE